MRGPVALLICALVVPVCGCSKDEVAPVGTQTAWDAKFAAANGIRNVEGKDDAMANLATQAAGIAGPWAKRRTILLKALSNIRNSQTHDVAARESAVVLAKRSRFNDALEIANKIHDTAIQDDALKQISQIK